VARATVTWNLPGGSRLAWLLLEPHDASASPATTPTTIPQLLNLQALNAGATYQENALARAGPP
jgi:hypothetical protein